MPYEPTDYERNELIEALNHARKEAEKARRRNLGQYRAPIIQFTVRNLTSGRFAPDDASEFRNMVDMFRSITASDYTSQDIAGVTGFDMKYANLVNEKWSQTTQARLNTYNLQMESLRAQLERTRNREERELIQSQMQTLNEFISKQEGYYQFDPSSARDKEQFKTRVLGRQGSYSEAYQNIRDEAYRTNFLRSLRRQGISTSSKAYREVLHMPIQDFIDMTNDNPNLHDTFVYPLADSGDKDRVESIIKAWVKEHAAEE